MLWLRWCSVVRIKLVALLPAAYSFATRMWVQTFQSCYLYSLYIVIVREMHLICASVPMILLRCPDTLCPGQGIEIWNEIMEII